MLRLLIVQPLIQVTLSLNTGNTVNVTKSSGSMTSDIEANGYSLITYEYTNQQTGTLSLKNYFGNYTISEWYIVKA